MKKLMGVIAIATVLSFVLMGCTPPAEGDTAPAPDTKGTTKTETTGGTATPEGATK